MLEDYESCKAGPPTSLRQPYERASKKKRKIVAGFMRPSPGHQATEENK